MNRKAGTAPVALRREHRASSAQRVADEVLLAATLGQDARTCKVTSLRHAFRSHGSTSPELGEVSAELANVGVSVSPIDSVRTGTVRLSLTDDSISPDMRADRPIIRVSSWKTGEAGFEMDLREQPELSQDVRWFNVDMPYISADVLTPREDWVRQTFDQLEPLCEGLELQMVRDLFDMDFQPKVEPYGSQEDGIRTVSVPAVIAGERQQGVDGRVDRASHKSLTFELVESIASRQWLITLWHPTRRYLGSSPTIDFPLLREPVLAHVRHRWTEEGGQSAGDLGVLLARSLVDTYGASHRMIERWVEAWELHFFETLGTSDSTTITQATVEISDLLSMVGEFRRRLTAVNDGQWSTSDRAWYPGVTGRSTRSRWPWLPIERIVSARTDHVARLAQSLDSSVNQFDELLKTIRADMDLLMLRTLGTQQEASERQQASNEDLQAKVAKVTALVLVPTLIAGVFGANTQLPGGNSWFGFELMLLLMVVSAVLVYLTMRTYFHKRDHKRQHATHLAPETGARSTGG